MLKFKNKNKKNQILNKKKSKIIKINILQNKGLIQKLKMKMKLTIKNFLKINDFKQNY